MASQNNDKERLKDLYLLLRDPLEITSEDTGKKSATSGPHRSAEHKAIAEHIESLALHAINNINNKDFDVSHWHLADDFTSEVRPVRQEQVRRLNREQYLGVYKAITDAAPEYHVEVTSITTEIKPHSKATTTILAENTGNPPGVTRQLVVILDARRQGGEWEFVDCKAHRGVEEFV